MNEIRGITQAIARISSLLEENKGKRVLIGIVGAPGAGKSHLSGELHKQLPTTNPTLKFSVVPMDGYHLSNQELENLQRRDRKGAPDTFDSHGFASLVQRISTDTTNKIYYPIFHREIEESIAAEGVVEPETQLVIIEGNYLLLETDGWKEIKNHLTQTWFIDVPQELRHERLINRHIKFGKSPDDARDWSLGSDERNADIIRASASRADSIFTF